MAVVQYTYTHKQYRERHKTNNTWNNTKIHRTTTQKCIKQQHKIQEQQHNKYTEHKKYIEQHKKYKDKQHKNI
jgi:hypothetical protein